jgi:hypothetical protein
MGKGALLSVVAVAISTLLLLYNAQLSSNETGSRENDNRARLVAQNLALQGRKLLLASWVQGNGSSTAPAFTTLNQDGGRVDVTNFTVSSDTLDFTVVATFQQTAHEIRSRYFWNDFALNALQFKVNKINPAIDPGAELTFNSIGLDDQSLGELEEVLFTDLGWAGSLDDYGLGMTQQVGAMETALNNSGNGSIDVFEIDQAQRDLYDTQSGILYPDQVGEAVDLFAATYPAAHTVVASFSDLGASFGLTGGNAMLTVQGDLTVSSDFSGKGILVVEGDLVVPTGVAFSWDGIILVKPPSGDLSPVIDLSGFVDIEGNLVALQDGMPNTGHMDLSVMRDETGAWSTPYGTENDYMGYVLEHEHDYTAAEGNYVVWSATDPSFPDHDEYTHFDNTLSHLNSDDSIFVEVFNNNNHGRGLVRFKLAGEDEAVAPISTGFPPLIALPGNELRTKNFRVADLELFDISITRLSALVKLWDNDEDYPGCAHPDKTMGPGCVWSVYSRMGALTFRIYHANAGFDTKLYEATLYWHRRTDEEEEFEEEMEEFADHLTDADYGLTLTIGPDATIREDPSTVYSLVALGGFGTYGVSHLGTWTRSWDPGDPGNPTTYGGD